MLNILITAGATREPIDGVRFITNFSSGTTGSVIADYFQRRGARVYYLHGVGSAMPRCCTQEMEFTTFDNLDKLMRKLLQTKEFVAVIHLAAVGDFALDTIELEGGKILTGSPKGKLDSAQSLKLTLKKNAKILPKINSYASKGAKPVVVGFKLTNAAGDDLVKAKLEKIFAGGGVDYLVHNDKSKIASDRHPANIYSGVDRPPFRTQTKMELAGKLYQILLGD